jgi:pyridoxine 4-dehydrogenase
MTATPSNATHASIFLLGGNLPISRIGFGAAGVVGPHAWGHAADRDAVENSLRAAIESGVNYIDTADAHGPQLAERVIRETLSPYAENLVIGTKGGMTRGGPHVWGVLGRPEYLVQAVELSLRNLGLERIDLYQLHRIDRQVPLADQVGTLAELQKQGKIRHLGLSEVTVEQLTEAREITDIVSVQNRFHLADRSNEAVLEEATRLGIAFIPWFPFGNGKLLGEDSPFAEIARRNDASPAQLILAWLLERSPSIIPIPGSTSPAHIAANARATDLELSETDRGEIDQIGLRLQQENPPPVYTL